MTARLEHAVLDLAACQLTGGKIARNLSSKAPAQRNSAPESRSFGVAQWAFEVANFTSRQHSADILRITPELEPRRLVARIIGWIPDCVLVLGFLNPTLFFTLRKRCA